MLFKSAEQFFQLFNCFIYTFRAAACIDNKAFLTFFKLGMYHFKITFCAVIGAKTAFADNLRERLRKYCETHKKSIPAHLTSVPEQKLTMPYEPPAMAFVYEAIKAGVHVRDLGEPCPETIAIFD